jgi:predicted regulator of Ras-like GTPase activity (Roadblock/LC7/MglB family)
VTNPGENVLSAGARDVNWLLDKFVTETDGVERAVGVSSDGLLMAIAPPLPRAEAEKLAAMISGMTSLALSASRLLSKGPLRQVITEFGAGYLLVSAIRDGSCLGVITQQNSDLGLVGYASAMLAQRVGALLTPELITELKTSMIR